ncbi:MAG: hypothetical protein LBR23_02815 [Spirochaetaceae bacterium]|jgi:hypothetical protein|nr:hypothetical protein [Spirochaetaceae bacterium]
MNGEHPTGKKLSPLKVLPALAILAALGVSCSPRAALTILPDSSMTWEISVPIEKAPSEFIASSTGGIAGAPVFNAGVLESRLKRRGFTAVSVTSATDTLLAFTARADSAKAVFASAPGVFSFTPKTPRNSASLRISIDHSTVGELLALFPPETVEYLDFFFAPLFTGEVMSQNDYIGVIEAVYGRGMAEALKKSVVSIAFVLPGQVSTVQSPAFVNTSTGGNKATLSMPLGALLSATETLSFNLEWK